MRALVFRHSLAREAASAIGGRVDRRAFVSRFAPVRIEDVPELPLPAADWVRVRTTFSGLCGSDVKQILLNGSRNNPLTALVSFPHVLGHEVVGRRIDTGERVVLNPWLSCVPRGIDPACSACSAGQDGPCVVYDTIGSVETVETSLRLLMTGGTLVVSGVEPPKRFEWTPLYFKELRVVGVEWVRRRRGAGGGQARDAALPRLCF
jgi:threonine dehydrogenase-like Zn-dependent dehydrogenase